MGYLQSDYGYISKLGQFFIPKAMQDKSQIRAAKGDLITIVQCELEEGHILLKHYKTVAKSEHKEIQQEKEGLRAVDELGRVILSKQYRDALDISDNAILVSYLIDDATIKIRPLVMQHSTGSEIA